MQNLGNASCFDNYRIPTDSILRSNSLSFNKRRPKFVEPGSYLDGDFQNIFDLCYFSGKELVPSGWNVIDDDKTYPSLSSRNPQVFQNADESEDDQDMTNGRAASDTSNEDGNAHYGAFSSTTRMADEDESDEDEIASLPPKVSLTLLSLIPSFFLWQPAAWQSTETAGSHYDNSFLKWRSYWRLGSSCPPSRTEIWC